MGIPVDTDATIVGVVSGDMSVSGTDATTVVFETGLAVVAALAVYALAVRVFALLVNRSRA